MAEAIQFHTGYAEVNGTRLYYEVAGAGHPLVLIHGALVDRRSWDDQFSAIAQFYKVIRYDMRGFGDSAAADTQTYSARQDLYSLLRFLGAEKAYVLGLSAGGSLAIDFTLEHPEVVDALIPVGAGISGFDPTEGLSEEAMRQGMAKWQEIEQADPERKAELLLRLWTDGLTRTPDQVDPGVRERVRTMTMHNFELPNVGEGYPEGLPLEPPALARLSEIHIPTLIVFGDKDLPTVAMVADKLADSIAGARKVVIPNTAHHLNMEQPAVFNRIVLDFLSALS